MKSNYLFPQRFKTIGWIVFIPTAIVSLLHMNYWWEPSFLEFEAYGFMPGGLMENSIQFMKMPNNFLDEFLYLFLVVSLILIAFSKEKNEDEFIRKIRLESLLWATYANYILFVIALFISYSITFLTFLLVNVLVVLLFFIVRFNWKLSQNNKMLQDEE